MWGALFNKRTGVCRLQLLLALANAVVLRSESRGTRDHIFLSQIQDFPLRRLLRLAGIRWGYLTPSPHEIELSVKVEVKVKFNLRLAVYRQSVRLGARALEAHDQRFFSQLNSCGNSPYVTTSLTTKWVCLL
jgi:hypothetical protein